MQFTSKQIYSWEFSHQLIHHTDKPQNMFTTQCVHHMFMFTKFTEDFIFDPF
jgi:hypothetical protein